MTRRKESEATGSATYPCFPPPLSQFRGTRVEPGSQANGKNEALPALTARTTSGLAEASGLDPAMRPDRPPVSTRDEPPPPRGLSPPFDIPRPFPLPSPVLHLALDTLPCESRRIVSFLPLIYSLEFRRCALCPYIPYPSTLRSLSRWFPLAETRGSFHP